MLRRTRPVSGVSELYPVRPGAKPWKAADDGREGGILHQRALSAPRIQAGEGWLPPFRPRGPPPESRHVHPLGPWLLSPETLDRQGAVSGTHVSVRVDPGAGRSIQK